MFGLGFGEIAVILVIALIVLGPNKLPELARSLGKGLREFRKATEDFKSTIQDEAYRPDPDPARHIEARNNAHHDVPAVVEPVAAAIPRSAAAQAVPAPAEHDHDHDHDHDHEHAAAVPAAGNKPV